MNVCRFLITYANFGVLPRAHGDIKIFFCQKRGSHPISICLSSHFELAREDRLSGRIFSSFRIFLIFFGFSSRHFLRFSRANWIAIFSRQLGRDFSDLRVADFRVLIFRRFFVDFRDN